MMRRKRQVCNYKFTFHVSSSSIDQNSHVHGGIGIFLVVYELGLPKKLYYLEDPVPVAAVTDFCVQVVGGELSLNLQT